MGQAASFTGLYETGYSSVRWCYAEGARSLLDSVQSGYRELHDIVIASYEHLSYELLRSKSFSYPYTK